MQSDKSAMIERPTEKRVEPVQRTSGPGWTIAWILVVLVVVLLVAWMVFRGVGARVKAATALRQETQELAIPSVAVAHPKMGAMKDEIVLPGNVQAFTDAPIYARTSGYLKRWYFDIGAHVKAGQLLADIETPEIDKQLEQARADVKTAETNLKLAEITTNRYQALLQQDAIARQDADQAAASFRANQTMVDSARANVKRLEDMVSFEKIYAPFDGVITARKTDIGALINAGSGTTGQELFHMAAIDTLRVYVNVPQVYSRSAVPGVMADLTLTEFPGRRFPGKLVRTSDSIDSTTRTLLAEVDVENKSGTLLPGAYAEVHLKLGAKNPAFIIPVTALIFRSDGMRVGVVRDGKTDLIPVVLGHDFGTEIEVASGITDQDSVIVNPPDSLTSGVAVNVVPVAGASQ